MTMSEKLGDMIDELFRLRVEKQELSNTLKELGDTIDSTEWAILQKMEELELDQAKTDSGTVSRKVELYPNIEDKEAFVNWCHERGDNSFMVVTANKASFRAFYEENNEYPDGINAYEKATLNVRKAR